MPVPYLEPQGEDEEVAQAGQGKAGAEPLSLLQVQVG